MIYTQKEKEKLQKRADLKYKLFMLTKGWQSNEDCRIIAACTALITGCIIQIILGITLIVYVASIN